MDRLSRWTIPYASDYTGVAASLYDLNGMTVFCDGGCCTDHYVLNDEPRWRRRQGLCFSTHLRSTEAVLGCDSTLIEQVCDLAAGIERPLPLIAVLGTPVPGILGTDMTGIATEIESQLGIPTLGFATSGFRTYDWGVTTAMKALVERFARDDVMPGVNSPLRVNILGATPLDLGDVGNDTYIAEVLAKAGWEVGLQLPMGATVEDLQVTRAAHLNLAVTAAGLQVARWLEQRWGMPWVAGCPAGAPDGPLNRELLTTCTAVAQGEKPSQWWHTAKVPSEERPVLVIADQVVGESVRASLQQADPAQPVAVASPFGWDARHAGAWDRAVPSEQGLLGCVAALDPRAIVADPTLEFLALGCSDCAFAPLVHSAVSGKLYWDEGTRLSELG